MFEAGPRLIAVGRIFRPGRSAGFGTVEGRVYRYDTWGVGRWGVIVVTFRWRAAEIGAHHGR